MRNSRPGFKIENLIAVLTILTCSATSLYAAEYTTCEAFYKTGGGLGFWGWTLIVGSAVVLGVTAFLTGGGTAGAVPAWMSAVGTWIGGTVGLSGAAAANWGLALLGGGAVAAGGLGIAGGVAVLTAASTFGTGVLVDYTVDKAMSHWSYRQFIAESKDMLSLPVPENTDGGRAYERTVEFIHDKFDKEQPLSAPDNQKVLRDALGKLRGMMPDEDDLGCRLKDATLLSLLYFQLGDYGNAEQSARDVFSIAGNSVKKYRMTMPQLLFALSSLYSNDLTGEKIMKSARSFRAALIVEPESEMMVIALAAYLDRVMYLYHYGKCDIAVFKELSEEFSRSVHADIAPKAFAVMATRCLVEIKRTQQDLYTVVKQKEIPAYAMQHPEIKEDLLSRYQAHRDMVNYMRLYILPEVRRYGDKIAGDDGDGNLDYGKLSSLMQEYNAELPRLKEQISEYSARLDKAMEKKEADGGVSGSAESSVLRRPIVALSLSVLLMAAAVVLCRRRKRLTDWTVPDRQRALRHSKIPLLNRGNSSRRL